MSDVYTCIRTYVQFIHILDSWVLRQRNLTENIKSRNIAFIFKLQYNSQDTV